MTTKSIIPWLGLIFITLKLMGYIDWSWWWITFPFWGTFILGLTVFGLKEFRK